MAPCLCQKGVLGKPECTAIPTDTALLSNRVEGSLFGFLWLSQLPGVETNSRVCFLFLQAYALLPQAIWKSLLGDKCRLSMSFHLRNHADLPYSSELTEARNPTANSSAFKRSPWYRLSKPTQKNVWPALTALPALVSWASLSLKSSVFWLAPPQSGLRVGRASWQETNIPIWQSQDTCLNSTRAQDEEGSGITLQEEDNSGSPREFLHWGLQ